MSEFEKPKCENCKFSQEACFDHLGMKTEVDDVFCTYNPASSYKYDLRSSTLTTPFPLVGKDIGCRVHAFKVTGNKKQTEFVY
jgi:hypothetical protein